MVKNKPKASELEKGPYYSIGQVAEYLELPQSVLRYWETVFDVLNPEKSPGGSRRYSDKDIKIISEIKHLLYERGFTIKGANRLLNNKYHMRTETRSKPKAVSTARLNGHARQIIKRVIGELKDIVEALENKEL